MVLKLFGEHYIQTVNETSRMWHVRPVKWNDAIGGSNVITYYCCMVMSVLKMFHGTQLWDQEDKYPTLPFQSTSPRLSTTQFSKILFKGWDRRIRTLQVLSVFISCDRHFWGNWDWKKKKIETFQFYVCMHQYPSLVPRLSSLFIVARE